MIILHNLSPVIALLAHILHQLGISLALPQVHKALGSVFRLSCHRGQRNLIAGSYAWVINSSASAVQTALNIQDSLRISNSGSAVTPFSWLQGEMTIYSKIRVLCVLTSLQLVRQALPECLFLHLLIRGERI